YNALLKKKDIIKIIQSEMQRYPEKIHLAYHSMIDGILNELSTYLKNLQYEGVLRDFDTFHAARGFTGLVFSFFNMQEILLRARYRKEDEEMILKTFVNIFVRGTIKL
ncbi:MAG: TetR/AcrR family transcriptional regulator C-terminal domain-containing protein, partial [Thermodesulfovibrionales bacterium]|nr:TetR/AcrR family transcriptional regulator C-terminal domain-containing protein [Thermodesulfovibrionales bacterium]